MKPLKEIVRLLTEIGLEVESTKEFESIPGGLRGVYVGKVLTCKQHPNADQLKVCTVDIGIDEPLQIVCGAEMWRPDKKYRLRRPGPRFTRPIAEESFKIKKVKTSRSVFHGYDLQ